MIVRQLRWGIVRSKFGRMGGVWGWSSSLGGSRSEQFLHANLYVSLRIYLTTFGLLLSNLTNPFFEDATWHIGTVMSASWSSTVANRCLLHIWRKEWETKASSLEEICILVFSYDINDFGNDIKRKDGRHRGMLNVELVVHSHGHRQCSVGPE